jgi:hypothetical protein
MRRFEIKGERIVMFITEAMSAYELEKIDMSREIKRLPIEHLKNIGKVSASTPPPCQPFTGDTPFPLSPADFSDWAGGTVEATPKKRDWSGLTSKLNEIWAEDKERKND